MKRALLLAMPLLLVACGSDDSRRTITGEATGCDAAQTRCQIEVGGLTVSLALQPGLVALKPFGISAEIDGAEEIEPVILDFQMVGMEMGPNGYRLHAGDSGLTGTATLPVCTTSRTDWLAVMEFHHQGRDYSLLFPFTSR